MHPLFIFYLTLFINYMIEFLIKTPIIYLKITIMIIFFLKCIDFFLLFVILKQLINFVIYGSLTLLHSAHHRMDLIGSRLHFYQFELFKCFYR